MPLLIIRRTVILATTATRFGLRQASGCAREHCGTFRIFTVHFFVKKNTEKPMGPIASAMHKSVKHNEYSQRRSILNMPELPSAGHCVFGALYVRSLFHSCISARFWFLRV